MKAAIIGTGYVGVVTGVTAALDGHEAVCLDVLREKVEALNAGRAPFFEPGLDSAIRKMVRKGRLRASTDLVGGLRDSDLSFTCVGTPPMEDGSADLRWVKEAARAIGEALRPCKHYHVAVMKSTVPPGTCAGLFVPTIAQLAGISAGGFGAAMNPEFLREGSALQDSREPDRIVIGAIDGKSGRRLLDFYKRKKCPKLTMGTTAAELVKYASNSFLATKIAFSNEMANLCQTFDVDVYQVMEAVGLDPRIGPHFLRAGAGFGGSCFPKDLSALARLAESRGARSRILEAVLDQNEEQPLRVVELAEKALGGLSGKDVAVLGLTFKPDTDDVRFSRAAPIIKGLLARGATVTAYDPRGMDNFKTEFGLQIAYARSAEGAMRDKDAVIFQTEWREFHRIRATRYAKLMRGPVVIDGRRTADAGKLRKAGVRYLAIGAPDGP
ncbi:MAG: UDP-glucose/GDP-mannose dehydrogenase family protein [Euryarchaeota archaeon]|nr:UDP-glucose/GDP-mannose dehydrogenase family protein [Euryarchaeota archaeon]